MKKTTVTWGILIGLILFSGLAAAGYTAISRTIAAGPQASPGGISTILEAPAPDLEINSQPIGNGTSLKILGLDDLTIPLPSFLVDQPIPDMAIILILAAVFTGMIVGTGIALYVGATLLGKLVGSTKESADYASAASALDKVHTAYVKEMKTVRPPDPIPEHDRPLSLAFSAIVLVMMMLSFFGAAFATSFTESINIWNWGYGFALAGLVAGMFYFGRKRTSTVSADGTAAVDWGRIWVVLTGLLIVGIGMGVMFFVRAG